MCNISEEQGSQELARKNEEKINFDGLWQQDSVLRGKLLLELLLFRMY
jgi:hypothetical protein